MPKTIYFPEYSGGSNRPVATEAELLEFANKVRAAGGANALEALLPGEPENPNQCLIANALNFNCYVDGWDNYDMLSSVSAKKYRDGSHKWAMYFPENMDDEQRRQIIDNVPGRAVRDQFGNLQLLLPKHIGNAAQAFDMDLAFQDYVK